MRFKAKPGQWKAYPLGRVPSMGEAHAGMRSFGDAPLARVPVDQVLDPIRAKARQLVAQLQAGGTPGDSLRAMIDQYLKQKVPTLRPRTQVEVRRHLLTDWAPLHGRPAAGLSRRDIAARLLELRAKGNVAANRARASLRTMYRWGIRRGLVDSNPVDGTEQTREQRRERFLSLDELRHIWEAAGDGDHGDIVRLLILLGQRREEVGGMRWSELDLEGATWHLPPARTKNGQAHWVPLPRQVIAILEARRGASERDNVFGNGGGCLQRVVAL